jgi:hypothetical protein
VMGLYGSNSDNSRFQNCRQFIEQLNKCNIVCVYVCMHVHMCLCVCFLVLVLLLTQSLLCLYLHYMFRLNRPS